MREIFARQEVLLPPGAQERLAQSTILIAGLGGLGCVVAEALARFGVGTLYLLDDAYVDPPDLHRQILYTKEDLGRAKVEVAAERLRAVWPGLSVVPLKERLGSGFALPEGLSGVVDALDNWASRFILERLCEEKRLFLVHAGLTGLFGQITSILPGKTPRLAEIFAGAKEEKTPPATASICFVLGAIQALEVVKLLLGLPETLVGRLLLVDLWRYQFELLPLG